MAPDRCFQRRVAQPADAPRLLSQMRILLIEDEKKTAAFLAKGLREAGFTVEIARDGETGLELARATRHDLLIVDVMLPKKDGWAVVGQLRGEGLHTPILFLTARDSVKDRVKGLELGADDYLVKPFAFSELLARARSVLRRSPARKTEQLGIEDLEIDTRRHKAVRSGIPLNLTAKEFLLLAHLARFAGEVVSRTEIVEEVWDINFETDTNVVDVMVRRLRAKVDDPFKTKLVHTVRGAGYVLKAG
jgi:two-component system copper resistance phosphate regulon response regulator CusR